MTVKELIAELQKMPQDLNVYVRREQMIKVNIQGCSYLDDSCKVQYCKYYDGMSCKHDNGAILTSTLLGAHPADCPLLNEVEND